MATWCNEMTYLNRPWLKAGGEGDDRGWDGWMASLTRWTWGWTSSGSWLWTGRPGLLQSMGSQNQTQLSNWTENIAIKIVSKSQQKRAKHKNKMRYNPQRINTMTINTYLSMIMLNVNGLNDPTKTHRVAKWIKTSKWMPSPQETQFKSKDTHKLQGKRRKVFHENKHKNKDGMSYLKKIIRL